MKKKEKWCPLRGHYTHFSYDHTIERARALWSVPGCELRDPNGNILSRGHITEEAIERARRIYERWDELQSEDGRLDALISYVQGAISDPDPRALERRLEDIIFWFHDLNATGLEVFSILAIYEARISKKADWPLELLALAEKYSPDVLRGKKFKRKPGENRKKRLSELRLLMGKTFLKFVDKHNRKPSAKELWEALPWGGVIDYIDGDELAWQDDNGKPMPFKTFQKHYTDQNMEYEKNKKK